MQGTNNVEYNNSKFNVILLLDIDFENNNYANFVPTVNFSTNNNIQ